MVEHEVTFISGRPLLDLDSLSPVDLGRLSETTTQPKYPQPAAFLVPEEVCRSLSITLLRQPHQHGFGQGRVPAPDPSRGVQPQKQHE
jgi:hypothetical protein